MSKPKPVLNSQKRSEPNEPKKPISSKKQVGNTQLSNSSDAKNVPLMFQAQIKDRGNIQYAAKPEDAEKWIDQWLKGCPSVPEPLDEGVPIWKRRPVKPSVELPKFGANVHTWEYQIRWRMVTNGGQDEGIIRPAIGSKGIPFFPGSSMKGAFRRECPKEKRIDYCGGEVISAQGEKQIKPGILRFHGGYPTDMTWGQSDQLLDMAHGQEKYQVQDGTAPHTPNIQISLYQPRFKFGISSIKELSTIEWNEIQRIWEKALGNGIGSRVSAGYGFVEGIELSKPILLSIHLNGQGLTSQLLSSKRLKPCEFRPNIFKAALRGHTLRLLAGITDEKTTQVLTKKLWGGIENGAVVGCVGIDFRVDGELKLREHSYQPPSSSRETVMSTYHLRNGRLDLLKVADITPEAERFLESLVKFSMLLGGFGKSWRRVHHGLFYPGYFKANDKPMIGCHWNFADESEGLYVTENQSDLSAVKRFLREVQEKAISWVESERQTIGQVETWREAWYSESAQVWGRIAKATSDSKAVRWFHGPYEGSRSIYKSELTGRMGQIGRMWHRMYPRYLPPTVEKTLPKDTGEFIELLTIFPNRSGKDAAKTQEFLDFLHDRSDFEKLW